jgi:hypothetical protein
MRSARLLPRQPRPIEFCDLGSGPASRTHSVHHALMGVSWISNVCISKVSEIRGRVCRETVVFAQRSRSTEEYIVGLEVTVDNLIVGLASAESCIHDHSSRHKSVQQVPGKWLRDLSMPCYRGTIFCALRCDQIEKISKGKVW